MRGAEGGQARRGPVHDQPRRACDVLLRSLVAGGLGAADLRQDFRAEVRTKSEVEALVARRFPKPELAPMVRALPGAGARCNEQHARGM
jgi:hypothetical protein